jgi:hypothetical protein
VLCQEDGARTCTHLVWQCHEVHGNWSSPASVSPTCPHSTCSLVHVRLVFGLLQAVEELQAHVRGRLDCLATRALHAQKALSAMRSMLFAQVVSSIAGCIAAVSGVRAAAARWCEVHPVSRPRRESRAHVQVRIPQRAKHSMRFLHTLSAMQPSLCAPLGCARTGAFCRFAGRPSPGLSAALPALRFDALSIFAYSWSRGQPKPI